MSFPQASHLPDRSGTDGKAVRAQEGLGPAWAAQGLHGGGGVGISGQSSGVGVDALSVIRVSWWMNNRAGPRGAEGSQPRGPDHHATDARSGTCVYFIEATLEGGLVSWHSRSLLLSRRVSG